MIRQRRGRRAKRLLVPVVAMGTISGGVLAVTAPPAHAATITGYACGYRVSMSLFGSDYTTQGCPPQTDPGASANSLSPAVNFVAGTTQYAADNDGAKSVYHGVATMFSSPYTTSDTLTNSGKLEVYTQGTTSVSAHAMAQTVGPSPFWTHTPPYAGPWASPAKDGWASDGSTGYVLSRCSASGPTSKSGNVTIKNGFVDTITGTDGYPVETVAVPNPTPINYRVDYVMNNVNDRGYIIFNERQTSRDGVVLTVTGAHMYMQGNNAWGDLAIAQVRCGVSA